ncbi:MAG: VCBS repeat-containing protein [Ignavibacteria bacterium]|nr:VCBS repeat-containing protein [Ignavibacteria bacterium]
MKRLIFIILFAIFLLSNNLYAQWLPGIGWSAGRELNSNGVIYRFGFPQLITDPEQNAININKSSDITVAFGQDMIVSTINNSNIKVYSSQSGFINCSVTFDNEQNKAVINPENEFKTGEEISVTLKSGIQYSTGAGIQPFVYQFTAAATSGTGIYTETSVIDSGGTKPTGIAAGDMDSDGDADLIIGKGNLIKIYKNNGAALFTELSFINENGYFKPADIDNDGDLDIIVSSTGMLKTFINDGTGSFSFFNSSEGSAGEIADLDGDGDLDIVFNGNYSSLSYMRNVIIEKNSNGIFSIDTSYNFSSCHPGSEWVSNLSVTDFNNDGKPDISEYEYGLDCNVLEHCYGCGYLITLKNSGGNRFTDQTVFTSTFVWETYSIFYKCLLLSFNKDNDNDADFISPFFNLTNLGNEIFTDDDPMPGIIYYATKGDYDGDGDIDISSRMIIFKNDGQGNFSEYIVNDININTMEPVSADFDNNGSLDFAGVRDNSNGVSVLLNDYYCPHPQYSISGDSVIDIGSTENIFVSPTDNGYWEILNYDSTQASIQGSSSGDTVLVSAGEQIGHFELYFNAYYECGGDTQISKHVDIDFPLPVELTSFTFRITGTDVILIWSTSAEVNNHGFDIEKFNVNGNEPMIWKRIGFVQGNGSDSSYHSYEFIDKGIVSGKYMYRLKQLDYNGNFKYYDLEHEVVIGIPDKFNLSQNFPNPFNPKTVIYYSLTENRFTELIIFDVQGKEAMTLVNEKQDPGIYRVELDGSRLPSGVYFYKLTSGEFTDTKRMILIK